jgi:hypothetical protein
MLGVFCCLICQCLIGWVFGSVDLFQNKKIDRREHRTLTLSSIGTFRTFIQALIPFFKYKELVLSEVWYWCCCLLIDKIISIIIFGRFFNLCLSAPLLRGNSENSHQNMLHCFHDDLLYWLCFEHSPPPFSPKLPPPPKIKRPFDVLPRLLTQ